MLDLGHGGRLAGLKRSGWDVYEEGLQAPELHARPEAAKLLPLDFRAPQDTSAQHLLLKRLVSALGGGHKAAAATISNSTNPHGDSSNTSSDAVYTSGMPLQAVPPQARQAAAEQSDDVSVVGFEDEAATEQERAAKRMRLQLLERLLLQQQEQQSLGHQLLNSLQAKQEQQQQLEQQHEHEHTLLQQLRQHQQQHQEEHQDERLPPAAGSTYLPLHLVQLLQSAKAAQHCSCSGAGTAGASEGSPGASMAARGAIAADCKSAAELGQQQLLQARAHEGPILAAVKAELLLEPGLTQTGSGRGSETGTGGTAPVEVGCAAHSRAEGAELSQQQPTSALQDVAEQLGPATAAAAATGPQRDQPTPDAEQQQQPVGGSQGPTKAEPVEAMAAVADQARSPGSDVTTVTPKTEAGDGNTAVSPVVVEMEAGSPAAAAASEGQEQQDLSEADDSAAVAAFLLRMREAFVPAGVSDTEGAAGGGAAGEAEGSEAPLPEVDILPLEAPEEGMLHVGDGVFVCPATAGPGITYWPLWKPNPNDDPELFPRVVRGLRTRPNRPMRPISMQHWAKLREAVAPDPRTPRAPRPALLGGLHPAALAQLLAAQQQQQLQLQQMQQQMAAAAALGHHQQQQQAQNPQPRFLVQRGANGQPVLVPLTGPALGQLAARQVGAGANPHAALLARLTGAHEPPSAAAASPTPPAALVAAALAGDRAAALLLAQQLEAGGLHGAAGGLLPRGADVGTSLSHDDDHAHDPLAVFGSARHQPHHNPHLHPHPRQHTAGGPARGLQHQHQHQALAAARHHPYGSGSQSAVAAGGAGKQQGQAVLPLPGVVGAPWVPPPPPRPPRNHRGPLLCSNCGTTQTPLWRKDRETGQTVCNACGIYKQSHNTDRPVDGRVEPQAQQAAQPSRRPPPPLQHPQLLDRGAAVAAEAAGTCANTGQRQLQAALEMSNRWAQERSAAAGTMAAADGGRSVPPSPSPGAEAEPGLTEGERGTTGGERAEARPLQLQLAPLARELSLHTLPLEPLTRPDAGVAREPTCQPGRAPSPSPELAVDGQQRLLDLNLSPAAQLVTAAAAARGQAAARAVSPLRLDEASVAVEGSPGQRPVSPLRLSALPDASGAEGAAGGAGGAVGVLLQHLAQQARSRQEHPEMQQQQQSAAGDNRSTSTLLRQLLAALHRAQAGSAAATGQDRSQAGDAGSGQQQQQPAYESAEPEDLPLHGVAAGGAAGAVKLRSLDVAAEGVVGTGTDRAGEGHVDARMKILQALALHRQQDLRACSQEEQPALQGLVGGGAAGGVPRISIDLTDEADDDYRAGAAARQVPLLPVSRSPQPHLQLYAHSQSRAQQQQQRGGLDGLALAQLGPTLSAAGAAAGAGVQLQAQVLARGSGWADGEGRFGGTGGGRDGYSRGGGGFRDRPQLLLHPMGVDVAGAANVSPLRHPGTGQWLQL
ncbi:hypothetical protein HYH02_011860 [Chlamydomonas schloesseri]|uniref:GATA-type domain-containing protein n=1 Tax=Chlamydomonas schloesseri TaxID=2026947 RepID=A0A835W4I8_9CHLO|nr:hypothetical protein HYH02_011860 [Chlamydomonas schloesseri]|eukprot:KAG2435566.1 hypothetical protein HYH02_011860 [Chlamydomonas schloesseri]